MSHTIKRGLVLILVFTLAFAAAPFDLPASAQTNAPQASAHVKFAHFASFTHLEDVTFTYVRVDGEEVLSDFKFKDISKTFELTPGEHTLEVIYCLTCTLSIKADYATTVNLAPDTDYVLALIGNGTKQPVEWLTLENKKAHATHAPGMGDVRLRVAHLAPVASQTSNTKVDICTDEGVVVPGLAGLAYKDITDPYLTIPEGDYDLKVTKAGSNCANTFLDLPSLRLQGGGIFNDGGADLFIIGDVEHQPLGYASTSGVKPTPRPKLKFAHFAPFTKDFELSTLGFVIDGKCDASEEFTADKCLDGVKFGDISPYITLSPGQHTLSWVGCLTCTLPTDAGQTITVTLEYDTDYTAIAVGNVTNQPVELLLRQEEKGTTSSSMPEEGATKLRVSNLAPIAKDIEDTKIDICTDDDKLVPGLEGIPYKGHAEIIPSGDEISILTGNSKVARAGTNCAETLLNLPPLGLMGDANLDGLVDGSDFVIWQSLNIIGDIEHQPLTYASTRGNGYIPKPKVRFAHFAPFARPRAATAMNVSVDGKSVLTDFRFGEVTKYVGMDAGLHDLSWRGCLTCTMPIDGEYGLTVTTTYNTHYTVVLVGNGRNHPVELALLVDERTTSSTDMPEVTMPEAYMPESKLPTKKGFGKLRAANMASFDESLNVSAVDFCTQEGAVVPGLEAIPYKGFTQPYLSLPVGIYDLKVTAGGSNCATELIDVPPILIQEGRVGSLFAIGDGDNYPLQSVNDEEVSPYMLYMPTMQR